MGNPIERSWNMKEEAIYETKGFSEIFDGLQYWIDQPIKTSIYWLDCFHHIWQKRKLCKSLMPSLPSSQQGQLSLLVLLEEETFGPCNDPASKWDSLNHIEKPKLALPSKDLKAALNKWGSCPFSSSIKSHNLPLRESMLTGDILIL